MTDVARRDVFQAIADPTRRRIIDLVSQKAMNVGAIAEKLKMSQPAVSQQIKILRECGIFEIETIGRERHCKIRADNLIPAFLWLEQYKQQWTGRIGAFAKYVNELHSKNKKLKK